MILRLVAMMSSILIIASCGGDDPVDVNSEFSLEVELSNDCNTSNECAVVIADCPLGCSVAINTSKVEHIEQVAQDLIDEYESSGGECYDYACEAKAAACQEKKCVLIDVE